MIARHDVETVMQKLLLRDAVPCFTKAQSQQLSTHRSVWMEAAIMCTFDAAMSPRVPVASVDGCCHLNKPETCNFTSVQRTQRASRCRKARDATLITYYIGD